MSVARKSSRIKRFSKYILPAVFDNETVSTNASFSYVEAFKGKIGFQKLIADTITFQKAPNSKFKASAVIGYMIDSVIQGYHRFYHMDALRNDQGYQKIKGTDNPSEKVCRDLLKAMPEESAKEIRALNRKLLELQAQQQQNPREVCLNVDDSVATVFGNQEGAAKGYNPRYKGRPSFKEKIGIIAGTNELLDLTLEDGRHNTNYKFLEFYKSCVEALPKNWILKRVRADRGLFDQDNFKEWEENNIEYVVKAKMQANLQKIIAYVNEHPEDYPWIRIDKVFSAAEITVPLPSWDKARRFILVRKKLPAKVDGQMVLDGDFFKYEYQAIVTNIDYLNATEIFHDYNQRCDIENRIDELKEGFAFDQNSQHNKKCNELFLLIKMVAYNLLNWFKRSILPESMHKHEISTLRRMFLRVGANIVGNGRYRHIRYAPDSWLEWVIRHVRDALSKLEPCMA